MSIVVAALITALLTGPIAAFITWFFNRKKYVADIYSTIADGSQTAVETMQITMQVLHEELNDSRQKMNDLMQNQLFLNQEIANLKERIVVDQAELVANRLRIYELTASLRDAVGDTR